MVVPHKQVTNLSGLNDSEIAGLFAGVKIVQSKLSAVFSTTDFTICIHDGPLAGQEVPHVHIHIIPRTPRDGGGTLMAMWPNNQSVAEPNHQELAELAAKLNGVL